ncbi:hypothetical protein KA517_00490, partial [Candidatus Gracilibacteria bacterium]|nr:hypothetical protein [Candidatus Gracilibacteria bacterium]
MGLMDKLRGKIAESTTKPVTLLQAMPDIADAQERIKTILATPDLLPKGIDLNIKSWEKVVDIRAIAQKLVETNEGDANYQLAVMPPAYDAAWTNDAAYGDHPDYLRFGDDTMGRRTKEIVHQVAFSTDFSTGEYPNNPKIPHFDRDRYFVQVAGGCALPKASVYHYA